MLKNIFIIVSLFSTIILSAGGGGSSFGGETTQDKYGTKRLYESVKNLNTGASNTLDCQNYLDVNTKVSVRLQNWFYLTKLWKGGYATTTVSRCGVETNVEFLSITQNTITLIPNMGYVHIPSKPKQWANKSFVKYDLELRDDTGTISTDHYVQNKGGDVQIHNENNWDNNSLYHMMYGK